MLHFKLPKQICQQIDKITRNFWWGQDLNKRHLHKVAWEKLWQSTKKDTNPGLRQIEVVTQFLLARHIWERIKHPTSLLAHTKNLINSSLSYCYIRNSTSLGWKSIRICRVTMYWCCVASGGNIYCSMMLIGQHQIERSYTHMEDILKEWINF